MTEPLIQVDGETLGYGAVAVLADFRLTIKPGERVALLGRSGAGKSTLLNAIRARLLAAGRVVALVPQDHALVPILSAYHNIYMGRLDRHSLAHNLVTLFRPFTKDREDIGLLARDLGISDLLDKLIDELSGGQRQRSAVGRALYAGGDVLLADEPVSALDEHQAPAVLERLLGAFGTSIVALHDVGLAASHCTRMIGLKDGKILFDVPAGQHDDHAIASLYAR